MVPSTSLERGFLLHRAWPRFEAVGCRMQRKRDFNYPAPSHRCCRARIGGVLHRGKGISRLHATQSRKRPDALPTAGWVKNTFRLSGMAKVWGGCGASSVTEKRASKHLLVLRIKQPFQSHPQENNTYLSTLPACCSAAAAAATQQGGR